MSMGTPSPSSSASFASAPVTIRGINADDFDLWLPLWKGYQTFYKVDLSDEVNRLTFSRFLDSQEPMHCALAEKDGEAIGLVHYIQHRSTWTEGEYCYLQDLFVSPEARVGGVGRKLIEHVYAFGEKLGCSRVYWLTQETNTTAMALYDRIADKPGFVQYRKIL